MGKPKHGVPDRAQWEGYAADVRPATDDEVRLALQRFVDAYVVADKRVRVRDGLRHRDTTRRHDVLEKLHAWCAPGAYVVLAGSSGFPQHLHARFGDLPGVVITGRQRLHVAIAGAQIAADDDAGIFVADASPVALLMHEVGEPWLFGVA